MIADSVSSAYSIEDRLNADSLSQLLFGAAVVEVGERAKGVLPECHDRIEQAVQLLLAGEVQWQPDGSVQVQGPEQEDAVYGMQDTCPCPENAQITTWLVHASPGRGDRQAGFGPGADTTGDPQRSTAARVSWGACGGRR